jgi:hypothetical protein
MEWYFYVLIALCCSGIGGIGGANTVSNPKISFIANLIGISSPFAAYFYFDLNGWFCASMFILWALGSKSGASNPV